jgi:hypothetical protein
VVTGAVVAAGCAAGSAAETAEGVATIAPANTPATKTTDRKFSAWARTSGPPIGPGL